MMFTSTGICYFLGLIVLISYVFTNHWLKEVLRFSNSSNLLSFIYPSRSIILNGMQELVCSAFEDHFSKVNQISESLLHILHFLDITLFNFNSVFFTFFSCIAIKKSKPYLRLFKNCLKW